MNAVSFDTLKMAQRLEAAGFSIPQAEGAAEALAEAITGMDLATKSDLGRVEAAVMSEIGLTKNDLRRGAAATRSELLNALEVLRRDMTIRLGSMMIVAVRVLLAVMVHAAPVISSLLPMRQCQANAGADQEPPG